MRYRPVGTSGLMVSVVGLGANNVGGRLDLEATRAVVHAALDAGITLIDTADSYPPFGGQHRGDSEVFIGRVLADAGSSVRDRVIIATKFGGSTDGANGPDWGARGGRRYIRQAVDASLRRLQTEWIDLYQYHRPDGITPLAETLSALDDLVRAGKVRYAGSSNLAAWQVGEAAWLARTEGWTPFVSAQNHYSLLERGIERELVPACLHYGVGIIPYFPLANGLLTGKYRRGEPSPPGSRLAGREGAIAELDLDRVEALESYAAERGLGVVDVAVGGLAAQPGVASVIAGATSPTQVMVNAAAAAWEPTSEDLVALDGIVPPSRRG
ncbi:MAG: aldo/keto reductase [Acidimicrobiales bacterium]